MRIESEAPTLPAGVCPARDGRRSYTLREPSTWCNTPDGQPRQTQGRISAGAALQVRKIEPPNWFTTAGVLKKRRLLERKGLPSFYHWKFLTTTLDRSEFSGEVEGFEAGQKRVARLIELMIRAGLIPKGTKWCRKLEFHPDSGWPHWHILIDYKPKWTHAQLARISQLWKLGRVNVEWVRSGGEFLYSFKYAFKPVAIGEDEYETANLPAWFATYRTTGPDGKPRTYGRIRFWQTSRGFYEGSSSSEGESREKVSSYVPWTPAEQQERREETVQLVARDRNGKYAKSACVRLSGSVWDLLRRAAFETVHRAAAWVGVDSYVITPNLINTNETWKLRQLLEKTKLTVGGARALRMSRKTDWQTS